MAASRYSAAIDTKASRWLVARGLGNTISAPFGCLANEATASLTSPISRPPAGVSSTLKFWADFSTACRYGAHDGLVGSNTKAIRLTVGTHSLRTWSHLPAIEDWKFVMPVTLPSGRARLDTKPTATGSST